MNKFNRFQPLKSDKLNTLQTWLAHLVTIIINECLMMGSNILLEVNQRLQQIKDNSPDNVFGHTSILAVGDLYQLPCTCTTTYAV